MIISKFSSVEVTSRLSDVKQSSIKPFLWGFGASLNFNQSIFRCATFIKQRKQNSKVHAHITCRSVMTNSNMSWLTACDRKLPDSRRGFVNRERRKAGLVLHSASRPLGKATPDHQRVPQEILPTMYKQCSAQHENTHTHTHAHKHPGSSIFLRTFIEGRYYSTPYLNSNHHK